MSKEILDAQSFITWINTKARLNALAPKASQRLVQRGQVYWCHFGLNIGSEMSKSTPRPAVVVSNYGTNKRSSNIIVVPVTHNQRQLPYLVPISPVTDADGKVILDGQADTTDIICVSKARLGDLITSLSDAQMKAIDKSMAISLDLLHYYDEQEEKYNKLVRYNDQVKSDRNKAQNALAQIKEIISAPELNDDRKEQIKRLLDNM